MDLVIILEAAMTQAFGPTMLAYALAAIGLNVHFGYTGMLNFGQAGFAAMGAYGLAITVATFGQTFWLGVAAGLIAAALLALLLGLPTLRLRADYLAIATISAAEIIRRTLRSSTLREWTGGAAGQRGFVETFREYGIALGFTPGQRFDFGPFFYTGTQLWVMIVGYTLVVLAMLLVWLAMRSPWGRVLKAIREDEDAVRSLGKNVLSYKIQALVLGGVIGALAGFIFAVSRGAVLPGTYSPEFTFYVYAMVILGGAARVFGPAVGAILFWFLFNLLTTILIQISDLGFLPAGWLDRAQVGPIVFVTLGLGIIVMLVRRPQGIFGDRREISLDVR